jgi:hypothetical protein
MSMSAAPSLGICGPASSDSAICLADEALWEPRFFPFAFFLPWLSSDERAERNPWLANGHALVSLSLESRANAN